MCYYDQNCLNDHFKFFIRIADCQESHVINFTKTSKTYVNGFLKKILALLDGKIDSFYDKSFHYKIAKIHKPIVDDPFSTDKSFHYKFQVEDEATLNRYDKPKTMLYIHADKETCSLQEWDNKIAIIKEEITNFKQFLIDNKECE